MFCVTISIYSLILSPMVKYEQLICPVLSGFESWTGKRGLTPRQKISKAVGSQRAKSEESVKNISKEPDFEEMSKTEGKLKNCWRKSAEEGFKKSFSQKSSSGTVTLTHMKTPIRREGQKSSSVEVNCTADPNPFGFHRASRGKNLHQNVPCMDDYQQSQDLTNRQCFSPEERACQTDVCVKMPRQSSVLSENQRVNNPEESFEYNEYGKPFSLSRTLSQHQRSHTGEKPCECDGCGKISQHCSVLSQHQRVHCGEKRHTCAEYGKSSRDHSYFIQHHNTHIGERPYECSECGKSVSKEIA